MPRNSPVGVIDIGSNSVRLVIFDGMRRVPTSIYNEKILCGLAYGMDKTSFLNAEGKVRAEKAIARFIKLSDVMGIKNLIAFGTSAVRDAEDGREFVKKIEKEYGTKISILSGEKEAQYAALGIISSFSNPCGVVGDLGGGSLELVSVNEQTHGDGMSFPLGPLRINLNDSSAKELYANYIIKYLKQYPLAKNLSGKTFYTVGGAFRNIAKVHMKRVKYPLKIIHNYSVKPSELMETLDIITKMPRSSLSKVPGITTKRSKLLPFAAILLKEIIKQGKPSNIIFSSSGVREGYLFSKLQNEEKQQDLIISGAVDMINRVNRGSEYGYELAEFIYPIFKKLSEHDKKIILTASILSEISCYEHTEYKAELAYKRMLDSSILGVSHKDRVFIAKCLYFRYSSSPDKELLTKMERLIGHEQIQRARIVGNIMRLARSLSGSHPGVLKHCALKINKGKLVIDINEKNKVLLGEVIDKRLEQLADAMGLDAA